MSFENVIVHFLFDEQISPEEIRTIIEHCFEIGCTTPEARGENETWYIGEATDYLGDDIHVSAAIDDMASNHAGAISLWYEDLGLLFHIRATEGADTLPISELSVSVDPALFKPINAEPPTVADLIELVKQLHEFMRPECVVGAESRIFEGHEANPIAEWADDKVPVFWLTVFSPEAYGLDRDRVLSAPAWRVEELADGNVLLVLAPNPLQTGRIDERAEEVKHHLEGA